MAEGTVQIGRIGLPTAYGGDGITLKEPSDITQSGRSMSMSGIMQSATANIYEILWLRDQILGLTDAGGEPVIPFIFSSFPRLDGFYRVTASNADRASGALNWSVDAERITDWQNPKVEIVTMVGVLPNSFSVTAGDMVVANPGTPTAYFNNFALGATRATRANGDGFTQDTYSVAEPAATWATYSPWNQHLHVLPKYWYQGGCRVEYDVPSDPNGSNYLQAVGRHPFGNTDTADIGRVRLSNGLVRVQPTGSSGAINTYVWDGAAWDGPYQWVVQDVSGGAIPLYTANTIRNTPEECVIRLLGSFGPTSYGPIYIDLQLRRGTRWVTGTVSGASSLAAASAQFGVRFNSGTASTALTGGLRRTANNGDGHREILLSNNGATITTGTGVIGQSSAGVGTFIFGIGVEVGGSGSSGLSTVAQQQSEFWGQTSESPLVVSL